MNEREREGTRGRAPNPGAWGEPRGGASGHRQSVRVPGCVRPPRVPQDQLRYLYSATIQ